SFFFAHIDRCCFKSIVVIAVFSESEESLFRQHNLQSGAAAEYREFDRHLPLKSKPIDIKEISRFAKDVVWKQSNAGKRIRLPFNMWKVGMLKCQVSYDDYMKFDPDRRDIVKAHWNSSTMHFVAKPVAFVIDFCIARERGVQYCT
ncbi:unnamed protein product, partial [Soboliphyme baturini]|uniref:Ig-like domain-containing protein n=1 Tax=Soboliphyme baturini TaxID=241478 RepID=A0A183J967_9BILA